MADMWPPIGTSVESSRSTPRDTVTCCMCGDDISGSLGNRRLLFRVDGHHNLHREDNGVSKVVRQLQRLMSLWRKGMSATDGHDSDCHGVITKELVECRLPSNWCCRRCERTVDNMDKKLDLLTHFYRQFQDCPLAILVRTLDDDNCEHSGDHKPVMDQTITIHGLIIQDSDLNEECNQIAIITEPIGECSEDMASNEPELEVMSKKRKSSEDLNEEVMESEWQTPSDSTQPSEPIAEDNRRQTRSQTSGATQMPNKSPKVRRKKPKKANNGHKSESACVETNGVKCETILSAFESETDRRVVSALYDHYYEGVMRALLQDTGARVVAVREVARHISRECLAGSSEVTKMSHSVDSLRVSELRKAMDRSMPSTVLLFNAMAGTDRPGIASGPVVAMISILIYVLNSHANLFQKIVATVLLNGKCQPSVIQALHSYRLSIAYETLVSFLDNNAGTDGNDKRIHKLIKAFQT
ncbi:unnamed protein product [Oppiella nova]|uniref:Uncharacterized protein n=1 Tax=Oppiella nova TaxID=334625 RepID=A0A7R9QAQ9_9ACAR|nr:unnamed protein product [Oppiella nova]CAG2161990.1 unnamed protein product [Oppiella nova]